MVRGNLAFRPYSDPAQYPVSLINRFKDFAAREMDMADVTDKMDAALVLSATTAAAEAGIRPADADHLIFPNFGEEMLRRECVAPLGVDFDRTSWRWAREVGHVGATDQFGALDRLCRDDRLEPGQHVLMVGIGGGFNWTSIVLEILDRPVPAIA